MSRGGDGMSRGGSGASRGSGGASRGVSGWLVGELPLSSISICTRVAASLLGQLKWAYWALDLMLGKIR
jgi:hypothetical protein